MSEPKWEFVNGVLPDGRACTVGPIVQLAGDEYMPETSDLVAIADDASLVVRMRIVLEGGRPVCTRFAFERYESRDGQFGPEIDAKVVRSINVEKLIRAAVTFVAGIAKGLMHFGDVVAGASYTIDENGRPSFWTEDDERSTGQEALRRRRRRSIDRSFLEEVAKVYRAAGNNAPTAAVAERFNTVTRNATRWVQLARKEGLLDEYVRSTKED